MKKIGVIGLGLIGSAWAQRYAAAGVLAGVWNRTPQPSFTGWKAGAEAVVETADVIQIVVADPAAVEAVLQSILPKLGPGKTIIQSSTIDPESAARFEGLVHARGAHYVEAPFTGSKPAAIEGKTVYFVGGNASEIDGVESLLAHVSEVRFRVGTVRQAAYIKLAMNLQLAVQMEGICEALTFARKGGLSDELFFEVFAKNAGYSGLAKMKESKLKAGDFSPQFSVKHMHKDMRLASGAAGCVDYPLMEAVRERLKTAQARGLGEDDYCSLVKLLGE